MEESKEIVKQISMIDGLKAFHNTHLEKYLSHKINAILFSEMKPDDVVQTLVQQTGNSQMPGGGMVERKIKAKEKLSQETKKRDEQEHILRVIEILINEEEKNE